MILTPPPMPSKCYNSGYNIDIKGELTKFFLIFVFLRSSIINFTPKIFPSKNVFNLIKSAIVFS